MTTDEHLGLYQLEAEVELELRIVHSGRPEQVPAPSPAEWLCDLADVERYETGLDGLLGAVEALQGNSRTYRAVDQVPARLVPDAQGPMT